uniref:SCP domain-containing protein n=1 Tax=Panagrolaimus superbus TaxID=310955 RepID=A0A914ZB06_9BILA
MAQKWANQATLEHNNNREIPSGENIFWLSGVDGLEDDAINGTSNYWWNELKKYGIISGTNVTYLKGMTHAIGHWSQMAWSSTQFIGCGFTKFQKKNEDNIFYYYTVCNYFPSGNVIGMPIYEIGNSCKKDSECTQKSKSICDVDSGLCYS